MTKTFEPSDQMLQSQAKTRVSYQLWTALSVLTVATAALGWWVSQGLGA